ncbi:MAG: carbohydrate deacetylase [Actinomycetota bacterium]
MSATRTLIITADDFGVSSGVNRAVVEAHGSGVLPSAALAVPTDAAEEAMEIATRDPSLEVGLHLILADRRPVADPGRVASLVTERGMFASRGQLLRRALRGQIHLPEVAIELGAQLEALESGGISPAFINGDQHVHVLPTVRDAVISEAARRDIAVRVPNESVIPTMSGSSGYSSNAKRAMAKTSLRVLARGFRRRASRAGVFLNQHFVSPFGFFPSPRFDAGAFVSLLDGTRPGVTELMVHPGYPDAALVEFWGTEKEANEREAELRALLSAEFAETLARSGIILTDFRHARNGARS